MTAEQNPNGHSAEAQGSIIPLGWKATPSEPVPVVRCTQIKRDGERCGRWSIRGYTKCIKHCGPGRMKDGNVAKYAAAVQEAARIRLVDDSDYALDVLQELLQPGSSEGIRLKAATEVLDRAGIRGGFDIKVEGEITVNAGETVAERLQKLAEGARAVEEMKARRQRELAEEAGIIDAEVVEDSHSDADEELPFDDS